MVHIRQKHWFDLVLVELLCILQWFNPVDLDLYPVYKAKP